MKNLLLFLACIFLATTVLATNDSLPKIKQGIYCDVSLAVFPVPSGGGSLGLGWRLNRSLGVGPAVTLFGTGPQSITGIGFQARITSSHRLLFHLESGYVLHSSYMTDGNSYLYHRTAPSSRMYFRVGGALRVLKIFQLGIDLFLGGLQAFDEYSWQTNQYLRIHVRPELLAGGLKFGVAIP